MRAMFKMGIAALLFAAGGLNAALAADEIGRVRVDGSEVILYDDNTWEYAEDEVATAPENCTVISSESLPVSVCLDPDDWQLGNLEGAYEHSFYNQKSDIYVGIITEKQVIDLDSFKKAIVTNAQSAAKLNKVETLEDNSAIISGHEFGHIVYRTTVDGIDVTFSNYYTKFDGKGSLQIVAFAGTELFDAARPVIDQVMAGVKVDE